MDKSNGRNYTANDDTFPTEVYFANGRKVGIAFDGAKPYLTVGYVEKESEPDPYQPADRTDEGGRE